MALVSKEFQGNESSFKKEYYSFKEELIKRKITIKDETIILQELRNGIFVNRTSMNYKSMLAMMYRSRRYRLIQNINDNAGIDNTKDTCYSIDNKRKGSN